MKSRGSGISAMWISVKGFFKQDIFTPVAYPYLFLPDLYISADTPFMSVYADLLGLCGRSD